MKFAPCQLFGNMQRSSLKNITDDKVARKLFRKLKRLYKPHKGFIVIGDKAYDIRELYTFFVEQIKINDSVYSKLSIIVSRKNIKSICYATLWYCLTGPTDEYEKWIDEVIKNNILTTVSAIKTKKSKG